MKTTARVNLGLTDQAEKMILDLANASHVAIQGQSRSGKSVLTYVMLAQLAQMRHVVVAGIDPTSILLGPFRDAPRPELRGLRSAESMCAAADATVAEMNRRIDMLVEQGKDKFDTFSEDFPLIVFVAEEWPGILATAKSEDSASGAKPAERLEGKINLAIGRLFRESAKVGIRVVLLAQRMSSEALSTDSRSQCGTAISLRVDSAAAVAFLHADVPKELAEKFAKFAPGEAFYEVPGRRGKMRSTFIDYARYSEIVRKNAVFR